MPWRYCALAQKQVAANLASVSFTFYSMNGRLQSVPPETVEAEFFALRTRSAG